MINGENLNTRPILIKRKHKIDRKRKHKINGENVNTRSMEKT